MGAFFLIQSFVIVIQSFIFAKNFTVMAAKILYTPTEVMLRNPVLRSIWDAQSIGYLIKLQLIKAKQTSRYNLVDEEEVLRFFYSHFPKYLHPSPVA